MSPAELRSAALAGAGTLPARLIVALTLYGEARNQSRAGQEAVVWVIRNRMRQWKQTAATVCLGKNQFSCWNEGNDPNHIEVLLLTSQALNQSVPANPAWLLALRITDDVLGDRVPDPTGGATYYCTKAHLESPASQGDWFHRNIVNRLRESGRIGDHVFYAETQPPPGRAA